ncbi:MAG TPA: nodulation protein NfeD [Candidatus Binataceae bacterium]|nr:nodulation protein NfeD [Candidatus Binataceae bacterium]
MRVTRRVSVRNIGSLAGLIIAIGLALTSRARLYAEPSPAMSQHPMVEVIDLDGVINPAAADFINDAIGRAVTNGASALVIELDTPGGLLTSARTIVKALLNAPVPIIVYVAPAGASAVSAGTFVTEAANIAAMAPGTTIGAAHPVDVNGGDVQGEMGTKVENFTASWAKAIAEQRGRNQDWAEQAVRNSASISSSEALKLHVVDIIAPDLSSLLQQASGRIVTVAGGRAIRLELADAEIERIEMRFGESVLNRLADPNLMYLLMIAGIIGIYLEFAHPGAYLPGVAGGICLLLALASFQVIPINLAGLALILFGAVMILTELFITSYGVLGLGGMFAFILGSLFLVDTSETNLAVNRGLIAGAGVAFGAIVLAIGYVVVRERRERPTTGSEGLIGEIGVIRMPITPGVPGRIFVHGETWRARSGEPMDAGTQARVMAVRGLEVEVEPVAGKASN